MRKLHVAGYFDFRDKLSAAFILFRESTYTLYPQVSKEMRTGGIYPMLGILSMLPSQKKKGLRQRHPVSLLLAKMALKTRRALTK